MGPPPDPEQMISLLENPQFASTMNEALQNPQVIDQMIQGNPLLRGMGPQVRQAMQDPNFRRMMTDPGMMRQMSQMSRQFGMGGGAFGGLGGGAGGSEAFPAPGITDTTPGQEGERTATPGSNAQQPPMNPFAMFGNMGAGGAGVGAGGAGANPFAALFNPGAFGHPAPATANETQGQENATSGATSEATNPNSSQPQQQQPTNNPFASLANNPIFQNPALMQQMLGAMGGGNAAGSPASGEAGAGASQFNPFAAMFGPGGMGLPQQPQQPAAPADTRPPEERYEEQLRQLNDMGFYEFERNVEALRRTGGSVQGAVEYLLTH